MFKKLLLSGIFISVIVMSITEFILYNSIYTFIGSIVTATVTLIYFNNYAK